MTVASRKIAARKLSNELMDRLGWTDEMPEEESPVYVPKRWPWDYGVALGSEEPRASNFFVPYNHAKVMMRAAADAITGAGPRHLVVEVARRHVKTWSLVRWLMVWMLDNWPEKRPVLASYGADLALESAKWVRDLIESHPELEVQVDPRRSAMATWDTTSGGSMRAVGVGGTLSGRPADPLLIDDPIKNREVAESELERRKIFDWFTDVAYPMLEPGAACIVSSVRWHHDDLMGRLRAEHENDLDWRFLTLEAIAESEEIYEMGPGETWSRKRGEALCPQRYDEGQLNVIRRSVGSYAWLGQYQQKPPRVRERPGAIWNLTTLRQRKKAPPRDPVTGRVLMRSIYVGIDPAKSSSPGSDESGIVVCGVDHMNEGWVLADYSGQYGSLLWPHVMVRAYEEWEADGCVVESFAKEETAAILKAADVTVPIVEVHVKRGKRTRAEPVARLYVDDPILDRHARVWHSNDATADLAELESQMVGWVPDEDDDSPDRMDALVHGLTKLMLQGEGEGSSNIDALRDAQVG